ncbi:MAG: histidinol-phosphate transaminase [Pseudomonadales bacterium]|nr:histidinol-phosphate transaminase [Pseudomonadales bacterium]
MAYQLNEKVLSMQPYQGGKPIEELTRELGITDIIKLASNENPRGSSLAVQRALRDFGTEFSRYPDGNGYVLKEALAAKYNIPTDMLTLGNGSNDVLDLIARVALSPETNAIMCEYAFVVYPLVTLSANAEPRAVPSVNWTADLSGMLEAIDERTRIIFLANPNNPTGTWVEEAALVDFLSSLPKRIIVVLDEAYFEYVNKDNYPDGMALLGRFSNLVVVRTFSKVYGLAAMRLGYAVSSPDLADYMNRVRQPFNLNAMGMHCAVAALQDTAYVLESANMNALGMVQLEQGLSQLNISWIPSAGNFIPVHTGEKSLEIYDELLKLGVIVRPLANYNMPEYLRVTVGLERENQRFLSSLDQVLNAL